MDICSKPQTGWAWETMYGVDFPNDLVNVIYKLDTDLILKSILKIQVKGLREDQERN